LESITLAPLGQIEIDPWIARLPKADLHIHQEQSPRIDRVLARKQGRPPYDWRGWATNLMAQNAPGAARLQHIGAIVPDTLEADAADTIFIARVADLLEEAAADGAVLVEVRFGNASILRPAFLDLFREAERQVQLRYPRLRAEAIATLLLWLEPERLEQIVASCLRGASQGLRGIDLLYAPYDTEADWTTAYRITERAAAAGLGVTAHAGEVSTANIAAALRAPGLTRIGHATYAAADPRLLDLLARSGATVECSLTCNVVLGASASYADHPILRFLEYGIPVALGTDDPVQICTTIGREYAIAHALGLAPAELIGLTRNAIQAAFTTPTRRQALLKELDEWNLSMPDGMFGSAFS
jgi:adenosine deaminase